MRILFAVANDTVGRFRIRAYMALLLDVLNSSSAAEDKAASILESEDEDEGTIAEERHYARAVRSSAEVLIMHLKNK